MEPTNYFWLDSMFLNFFDSDKTVQDRLYVHMYLQSDQGGITVSIVAFIIFPLIYKGTFSIVMATAFQ